MRRFALAYLLPLFCLPCAVLAEDNGLIGPEDVVAERADEATRETSYTDIYSLKGIDGCQVFWRFEKGNAEYPDDRLMYDGTVDCTGRSFKELIPLHQTVLGALEEKEDLSNLQSVIFFDFVFDGDYSWANPVAAASATDAEHLKMRKNAPDSGISSNDIFVRLANETDAYEDLQVTLFILGLKAELTGVEKVFQSKLEDYPAKDALKGIKGNPWLLYNVGTANFQLSKQDGLPKSLQ